jgi:hypothetical protein
METGYNWNDTKKNGSAGQLTANASGYDEKYPFTKEGHKGFMADLINGLKGVNNGRCIGLLYWDPCMIHVEDESNPNESLSGWAMRESDNQPDGNVVENTTLFDFDGKAIPTVGVFANSRNSEKGSLEGGYEVTTDEGKVKATVKNNYDAARKVNLYVVTYDEFGVLDDVKIDSQSAPTRGEAKLELNIPENENYRIFLWDGKTISPINK